MEEVRFPPASGEGEVRGVVHSPSTPPPKAGIVLAHGRSVSMDHPLIRRIATAASEAGLWALRFNFRYTDEKRSASRDLSREEGDLLGAVRFARSAVGPARIFVAGGSMGARVCARASKDPEIAGMIAVGYPLHPPGRPQVRNPPEWPLIAKPVLFVQGDHDDFCDLARMAEELPRLPVAHELVVIPNARHSLQPVGGKRDTFPEAWAAISRWLSRFQDPPSSR